MNFTHFRSGAKEDNANQKLAKINHLLFHSTDIPTIVIDLGSGMIKAGFAGEDAPRWMFNSVVGSIKKYSLYTCVR